MVVCQGGRFLCTAHVRTDENNRIRPFATPSGLGPADFVSAYHLSASTTSTATIAIVDAFNDPNAASDLAAYRSQFGLPPSTVASGRTSIRSSRPAIAATRATRPTIPAPRSS